MKPQVVPRHPGARLVHSEGQGCSWFFVGISGTDLLNPFAFVFFAKKREV